MTTLIERAVGDRLVFSLGTTKASLVAEQPQRSKVGVAFFGEDAGHPSDQRPLC